MEVTLSYKSKQFCKGAPGRFVYTGEFLFSTFMAAWETAPQDCTDRPCCEARGGPWTDRLGLVKCRVCVSLSELARRCGQVQLPLAV